MMQVNPFNSKDITRKEIKDFFDLSLDFLFIIDLDGIIKRLNSSFYDQLGYTEEELINLEYEKLIFPEDYDLISYRWRALKEGRNISNFDIRLKKKEGNFIWTQWNLVPDLNQNLIFGVGRNINLHKEFEDQLRSSEAELRAIFAAINDLILLIDKDGKYLKIAPTNSRLLSKPEIELLGKKIHDVYPKKIADKFLGYITEALETGNTVKTEYKAPIASGEERWFSASISPMLPDSIVWMARDISDAMVSEEALRQSEEKHRTLFETMTQGVIYEDLEKGIITANPAAEKILGVPIEQMEGKSTLGSGYKLIHEDGTEVIDESHPAMVAIKIGKEVKNIVLGVSNRIEPDYRWININAVPLFKPGEDKPSQVYTTFDDITERKRSEEALKESEERYRKLVELSPNTVGIVKENKITFVNAAGASLVGAESPEEIIGKNFTDFIHSDHQVPVMKILNQLGRRKKSPLMEMKAVKLDGTIIYVEIIGMSFIYKGEEAVQFILQDITARKRVEEERERLFNKISIAQDRLKILSRRLIEAQESERRVLSRELHDEIGQTLTAIKIDLQTVNKLTRSVKLKTHLKDSVELVEHALQQVRNLSLDLRPSLLDDLGLIPTLRWYIDKQAQRTGLNAKLTADVANEKFSPEISITCYRVIQEAITNVIRHANAKNVNVILKIDSDSLKLNIEDDGKGFDIRSARKKALGGASIGVLGMQERVELVGGELSIHSYPEKGTKISAVFPLKRF
jgi:PAS domain S-box-containing protein